MKLFATVVLILFAATFSFADDSSNLWEQANKDLRDAKELLVNLRSAIAQSRQELNSKLEDARNETDELLSQLKTVSSAEKSLAALSQMSKYYDALCGEIYAQALSYSKSNLAQDLHAPLASTIAEASQAAKVAVENSFTDLFEPMFMRDFSATAIKDKLVLSGQKFRIGGYQFFVSGNRAGFLSSDGVLYGEEFAEQIIKFAKGDTDEIPVDASNGVLLQTQKNARTLAQEIRLGGIWMYPILFFGGLSLLVCVIKIFYFLRIRRAPSALVGKIFAAIDGGRENDALCDAQRAGYPYSKLMSDLIKSRNLPPSKLEEISYESMLSAGGKLFAGLSVLSVTAAVAPLFGLLGTVTVIIKTFGDLSFQGASQAQFISAGISEALITTEYGLIVAIPAFVAHALFSRRAKAILADMEKMASSFLGRNS